jgi:hypothetical protein
VSGARIEDGGMLKAACPFEGGVLNNGSTCGIVSGGCMGVVLAHAPELATGDADKTAAVYGLLKDYTRWFEGRFGSTLCRERVGTNIRTAGGVLAYLFTGKAFTRCMAHAGPAGDRLVSLATAPLDEAGGLKAGGLCAKPVLAGIRETTGRGDDLTDCVSMALDGGVGLSGGACGALGGALLDLGRDLGFDPRAVGFTGVVAANVAGYRNILQGGEADELWSVGHGMLSRFFREFGSLECRAITGRSFEDVQGLETYVAGSEVCSRIKSWCIEEACRRS